MNTVQSSFFHRLENGIAIRDLEQSSQAAVNARLLMYLRLCFKRGRWCGSEQSLLLLLVALNVAPHVGLVAHPEWAVGTPEGSFAGVRTHVHQEVGLDEAVIRTELALEHFGRGDLKNNAATL